MRHFFLFCFFNIYFCIPYHKGHFLFVAGFYFCNFLITQMQPPVSSQDPLPLSLIISLHPHTEWGEENDQGGKVLAREARDEKGGREKE